MESPTFRLLGVVFRCQQRWTGLGIPLTPRLCSGTEKAELGQVGLSLGPLIVSAGTSHVTQEWVSSHATGRMLSWWEAAAQWPCHWVYYLHLSPSGACASASCAVAHVCSFLSHIASCHVSLEL